MLKKCDVCDHEYETRSRSPDRERFCSKKCNARYWNQRTWAKRKSQKPPPDLRGVCEICNSEFIRDRSHPNARTCSQPCSQKRMVEVRRVQRGQQRDLSERKCEECGTAFTPSKQNWKKKKFCSHSCVSRVAARAWRKRNPGADRLRQQKARWGGNWFAAYERDNGCCGICGKGDRRIEIHHIDGTGEDASPNHELENLIVLCTNCHRQMHELSWKIVDNELLISGLVCEWLGLERVRIVKEAEHAE